MKIKLKVPRKLRHKVTFTINLLFFGLIFYGIWWLAPSFYLMKIFTAKLVSYTTGSVLLTSMDGIFLKRGSFVLQIITDCTAWKEIFVFLALFLSWPKKKDITKAIKSLIAILVFNLLRLDILMWFPNSFDYFHPGFQYLTIGLILFLWTWSVGITKIKLQIGYTRPRKKAKKRKKR